MEAGRGRALILFGLLLFVTIVSAGRSGLLAARRDSGPDWEALEMAGASDDAHEMILFLKQENMAEVDRLLRAVSEPKSPHYGHYLSKKEVEALVLPTAARRAAVAAWVKRASLAAGVTSQLIEQGGGSALRVRTTRAVTERMFGVPLNAYVNSRGQRILRVAPETDFVLPADVEDALEVVIGVYDFPPTQRRRAASAASQEAEMPVAQAAATKGSEGPQISIARASGGKFITVSFAPFENMESVTKYEVRMVTLSDGLNTVSLTDVSPTNVTCGTNSCTLSVAGPLYNSVQVSLRVSFASGSSSSWNVFEHPVLATPAMVPPDVKAQYSMSATEAPFNTLMAQCVVEFEQQYYSPSDLSLWLGEMGLPEANVTLIGFNNAGNVGIEANLDVQWIMGMAPGIDTWVWNIDANSSVEIDHILTWLLNVQDYSNPPLVNSLSYGMTEANVPIYLGANYIERSDVEFKKCALRGLTILIASGDTGAGDLGPPPMSFPTCETLHADWPSQSPYITSVSSTVFTPFAEPICYLPHSEGGINCAHNVLGEILVSVDGGLFWTGGGGFSNTSTTAWYQEKMVRKYLENSAAIPPANMFNAAGRAYPDVVAVGHGLLIAANGAFMPVDGTSASAPIFAGMVSMLNYELMSQGKPPLGFLNPMLYEAYETDPSVFSDVTVGNNRCGAYGWNPVCCVAGFAATQGFDAATGLGSLRFDEMLLHVLRLN